MYLVTNSVQPQQVTDNGDHYLIENVPFVRPMRLSGGYVPEASIKQTANKWANKPATLNHPRGSNGEPVAAERKPQTHIGEITNPRFDGEFVRGDIRINKADLTNSEAADIAKALENGEQIDVSSQYAAQELEPGEYDGEYRENVERIVRPDSVAILPNKTGKCSIEDGCGINPQMVANAEVSLTAMRQNEKHESGVPMEYVFDNPGDAMAKAEEMGFEEIHTHGEGDDAVFMPGESHEALLEEIDMEANQDLAIIDLSPGEVDEFTDSEWDGSEAVAQMPNPSKSDENAQALDQTHVFHPTGEEDRDSKSNWLFPFRESPDAPVNTRALVAIKGSRGVEGTDRISEEEKSTTEDWVNELLMQAPDDLFGSMDTEGSGEHMEDNALRKIGRSVLDMVGLSASDVDSVETTGAESLAGNNDDGTNGGKSPSSADSDSTMNREKLIDEITANSPLTEDSLEERCNDGLEAIHSDVMEANDETDENMTDNEDAITFESEDEFEEYVDEIVANRVEKREKQTEKESLATEIVSNSAEYDETENVLEDYPTKKALTDKKDLVTGSDSPVTARGTTANAGDPSDTDEYPTASIRGDD